MIAYVIDWVDLIPALCYAALGKLARHSGQLVRNSDLYLEFQVSNLVQSLAILTEEWFSLAPPGNCCYYALK
jgi:hypothetical protein